MPAEAGAARPSSACKLGRHNDVVFQKHVLLQFPHFETRVQASFIWTRVLVRADDEDDGRLPPQSRSASGEVYSLSFSNPTKLAFSSLPPPPILIFIQSTLIHCVSPHKLIHGFSKSQTSKIVRSQPQLIVSDPEKSLLPKLQFFYSKGVSKPDVARIVVSTPAILKRSLENQIIPSYNFFKDFFQSEEMAMGIVKRFARILLFDLHTYVESNINALQEFEVPKSNIAALLRHQPRVFMVRPNQFREILEEVKKMGFDPSQMKFVLAVQAIRGMSKSTWERKIDAYKSWCCSEEEIRLAFLKLPWSMVLSEDKLMATMDFYVNKMGWESSFIARRPVLLSLSLEKRIIPRYSVVQVLLSKGLINKDISPRVLFESTEKKFMQKFVNLYKKEASQLLNLYQERKKSIFQKKQDCLPEGRDQEAILEGLQLEGIKGKQLALDDGGKKEVW
ncbi:hypothetical protein AAG906_027662 [Vitis piasezkii]